MAFTAVGSFTQATTLTPSVTTVADGDLYLLGIQAQSATVHPTGVSGGGCTGWTQMGTTYSGTQGTCNISVWAGQVASAGTATLTVTLSGTAPAMRIAGQEFSATGAWAYDTSGGKSTASSNTFPSLTPAGAGELYFSWSDVDSLSAGSTSGYTYDEDSHSNWCVFNPSCTSSAQAPAFPANSDFDAFAVLLKVASSDAAVTPAVLAVTGAMPAVTASGSAAVTMSSALAVASTRPAPGASGSAAATPAALAVTSSAPAVTVSTSGNATATPAVLAVATARPAPVVRQDAGAAAATLAIASARPAPVVRQDATAVPATLAVATARPAVTITGGTTPHGADSAQAVEAAFYGRGPAADAGHAAEGAQVTLSVTDSVRAADRAASAWPHGSDACQAADSPVSAWPHGADAGHAAEGASPVQAGAADTGHGTDAVHEMGIWTYLPVAVRLLLPEPYRHDPAAAKRLDESVRRLAERGGWAAVTLRVASADRAAAVDLPYVMVPGPEVAVLSKRTAAPGVESSSARFPSSGGLCLALLPMRYAATTLQGTQAESPRDRHSKSSLGVFKLPP